MVAPRENRKGKRSVAEQTSTDVEGSSGGEPTRPSHRWLPLWGRAIRVGRSPDRRFLLPLHHVPKNYGGLYQATVKFAGSTFAFEERRTQVLSFERLRTKRVLRGVRFADRVLYDGNQDVWVLFGSLDHPEDWPLTKDAVLGQIGAR